MAAASENPPLAAFLFWGTAPLLVSEVDLAQNRPGFCRGISGGGNWTSHHDVRGASGDGLGRRYHSGLIAGLDTGGTYSRSYNSEIALQFTAQCGSFSR